MCRQNLNMHDMEACMTWQRLCLIHDSVTVKLNSTFRKTNSSKAVIHRPCGVKAGCSVPNSSSCCFRGSYCAALLLGRVSLSRKMLDMSAMSDMTAADRQGNKNGLH